VRKGRTRTDAAGASARTYGSQDQDRETGSRSGSQITQPISDKCERERSTECRIEREGQLARTSPDAWSRSTDQKVGGSNPSGCASVLPCILLRAQPAPAPVQVALGAIALHRSPEPTRPAQRFSVPGPNASMTVSNGSSRVPRTQSRRALAWSVRALDLRRCEPMVGRARQHARNQAFPLGLRRVSSLRYRPRR
jgi:hypothetical protein